MAPRSSYDRRFGSIRKAYELIGYSDPHVYYRHDLGKQRLRVRAQLLETLSRLISKTGGQMSTHAVAHDFNISNGLHGYFMLLWNYELPSQAPRWRAQFFGSADVDFYLIGRMLGNGATPIDYYLVPQREIGRKSWRMSLRNGAIDVHRHKELAGVAVQIMRGELAFRKSSDAPLLGADAPKGGRPHLKPVAPESYS